MVTTTRVSAERGLQELAAGWNQIAGPSVLRRREWLLNWWNVYRTRHDLFVLRVDHPDAGLIGIAPWYRSWCVTRGRVVNCLGNGKVCTDYQSLLVRPGHEHAVTDALSAWLASQSRSTDHGWDVLDFESVAVDDVVMNRLAARLSESGAQLSQRPAASSWRVTLVDRWDDHLRGLSQGARRKIRRIQSELIDSGRADLQFATNHTELDDHFELLVRFHQRRWEEVGVEGCFSYPHFGDFLRRVVHDLHDQQRLRLSQARIDGQPAAVSLNLRNDDGGWCLYQSGMNSEMREHQPGWLLNVLVLQEMVARGVPYYDYLRGDERYKRELGAVEVPQIHLRLAAPHLAGRIRHSLWTTHDWLRDLTRQWVPVAAPA